MTTHDDDTTPAGKPSARRPHLRPVADGEGAPRLDEHHLADLRKSGLTDETIALAGLHTERHAPTLARYLGRKRYDLAKQGPAIVFPFRRPGDDGKPYAHRVKPTTPRMQVSSEGKRRAVKYDQDAADGLLVYFEPRAMASGAYKDAGRPLYLTEGEKKTLALGQLGFVAVGLTGVWNYHDPSVDERAEGRQLHADIAEHVAVVGRHCVIVFDADARENDQVMLAARRVAGQLEAAGARSVKFVTPPDATRKQGIDDYLAEQGPEKTLALLDTAVEVDSPIPPKQPLARVRDFRALRGAPRHVLGLYIPSGYDVRKDGSLWAKAADPEKPDKLLAPGVILVGGYRVDIDSGAHLVEVCFQRRGRWVSLVVPAKALVDRSPMLAELAPALAPVTANNAAVIIDWLSAFKVTNEDAIGRVHSYARVGWLTYQGAEVFALGEHAFGADGPIPDVVPASDDREFGKLAAALTPRGTFGAHLEALRTAWDASPTAALMICASLATPLLEPLGAPNFAIHVSGDSSKGKTSMLMLAASVWGDPEQGGQFLRSWITTETGAEQTAAQQSGLPLCYDEVGAADTRITERLVYMLINGSGKGRGSTSLRARARLGWRTIVLSTGEHPLASETSSNTGAQVRVIQPHVAGFAEGYGAKEIDALRATVSANRGQVGARWIETVLGLSDAQWTRAREDLRAMVGAIREQLGDGSLAQRQAVYWGLLATVEVLLARHLGIGKPTGETIGNIAVANQGDRQQVRPIEERALDLLRDWMASEPATFPELSAPKEFSGEPASPGARFVNGYRRSGKVLLVSGQLQAHLAKYGVNHSEVLRGWARRGWILPKQGNNWGRMIRAVGTRLVEIDPMVGEDEGGESGHEQGQGSFEGFVDA